MSNKQRTVYRVLNHSEHLLVLFTTVTGCVSISAFASSVGIPRGITSSAIDLKFCVITAGIRKYTSTIKKKKKAHDKIALLAKSKLNSIDNMMDINVDLPQWFIIFGETLKNEIISNKVLPEELHKQKKRKMEKRKVHSPFIDNIWRTDMPLISKFNNWFWFSLCITDIYSKYSWVIPLKDKIRRYNYQCFSKTIRWIKS